MINEIEQHAINTIDFLACEYDTTQDKLIDKFSTRIYNICEEL